MRRSKNRSSNHALAVMALAMCASAAHAVDGVIEINHARALAGGVTATDTPGYPVTIDASGSYRLTGNLSPTSVGGGIPAGIVHIVVSDVALDLNGFKIEPEPPLAGATSGIHGILADSADHVSVSNGKVKGFVDGLAGGILLGDGAFVDRVHSLDNNVGITVGAASIVSNSYFIDNFLGGIGAGAGSKVIGNVGANGGSIFAAAGSVVLDNAVRGSDFGLIAGDATVGYANNVFTDNNGGNANAQVLSGTQIGTNLCGTDTTCP